MIIEDLTGVSGDGLLINATTDSIFDANYSGGPLAFSGSDPFTSCYFLLNRGYTSNLANQFSAFGTQSNVNIEHTHSTDRALSLDIVTYIVNEQYPDTIAIGDIPSLDKTVFSTTQFNIDDEPALIANRKHEVLFSVGTEEFSGFGVLIGFENIVATNSVLTFRLNSTVETPRFLT